MSHITVSDSGKSLTSEVTASQRPEARECLLPLKSETVSDKGGELLQGLRPFLRTALGAAAKHGKARYGWLAYDSATGP